MTYNKLSLNRHQNAGRKATFSKASATADFAPLWQLGGLVGGAAGGLKGGLEQNSDGSQISAGERLLRVGTNALAGGVLGSAAGGGLRQLANESDEFKYGLDNVRRATGVNPAPDLLPIDPHQRRMLQRQQAASQRRPNELVQQAKGLVQTGINDINQYAVQPVLSLPQKADAFADRWLRSPAQRMERAVIRDTQQQQAGILQDQISRARYALASGDIKLDAAGNPMRRMVDNAGNVTEVPATDFSPEVLKQVQAATNQDNINQAQRVAGAVTGAHLGGATGSIIGGTLGSVVPGVGTVLGAGIGGTVGTIAGGGGGYRQGLSNLVNSVYDAGYNLANKLPRRKPPVPTEVPETPVFSYMGGTANFYAPYTTGAMGGAVVGTGIGAGLGLANGVNAAANQEQAQLDQIQAIPDPYARKKEWDTYDADLSRTGRNIGYGVQTAGNTLATAGLGAAGGALLGGAGLTAYENIRNKRYNLLGQRTPSRTDGLKIFLTGGY